MIHFGVLGAARIVPNALVNPCADDERASIRCIAARDRSRAESFAKEHGIPVVCDDYRELIEDASIDAVYNPLPISLHHSWTINALGAGKHVLCEKSFASNAKQAEEMARVAGETGLVLMDAFHYRYHPVFIRAREIVESGMLGRVRTVEGVFHAPVTDPEDIRMNYATGGGVTMDIGCYPFPGRGILPLRNRRRSQPQRRSGRPTSTSISKPDSDSRAVSKRPCPAICVQGPGFGWN